MERLELVIRWVDMARKKGGLLTCRFFDLIWSDGSLGSLDGSFGDSIEENGSRKEKDEFGAQLLFQACEFVVSFGFKFIDSINFNAQTQ